MKQPQPIRNILESNDILGKLNRQLERFRVLENHVKEHLPASLGQETQVANLSSEGCLTLSCKTSSQATILRYQLSSLQAALEVIDPQIKKITIRVHHSSNDYETRRRQ